MKENPVVSVVIPTYNRVGLLSRAVESVRDQSFSDFELIIINDASTDGTKNFLDALAKKDSRIRAIHNEKNNYPDVSGTRNKTLALACGIYIAPLDDDDYWCDPEKLKKQVAFLDAHPDYVIAGGGTIVIDENDHERFRYMKLETDVAIRDRILIANPFTQSTVMFRRDAAMAVGGYGNFKNAEDWDLWLKLGARGKFYNFQEYFARYLMNDQSKTVIFKRSQTKEIFALLRLYRHQYPNFFLAYMLNFAQYCFSLFPRSLQKVLYTSLSRAKRSL
jgi:glycosyltransferase EpsE